MGKFGIAEEIVSLCERQRSYIWNEFTRIRERKSEVCRYYYPKAVESLEKDVRELNGVDDYDDDKNRLTFVPLDAFRICVNGFYVHLTGPNTHWFKLTNPTFGKSDEQKDDYYKNVYEQLTDATRWVMSWCGAYKEVQTVYKHLVAAGFACMLAVPDEERYVRVQTLRLGTYALGIDLKGAPNRVVRHFAFNAEQMADEFGVENLGDNVKKALENKDTKTMFEVWNLIEPHVKRVGIREPFTLNYRKFKYRSIYWSNEVRDKENGLLAVRGFEIKPFVAPRINHEIGDIYGRGLCEDVLGHARALQTQREDCLDIDDQNAHPSMMAPASMSEDGLQLSPLSVNWYPDGMDAGAVYRTIRDGLDTTGVREDAAIAESEIRKALLNSEFETINAMEDSRAGADEMTATEVNVRVNEKMEQLSGIATTLNSEWLDPFVTMMANYVKLASIHAKNNAKAQRKGLPEIVNLDDEILESEAQFDIKYESRIHAAANAQTVNAGYESLSRAGAFAEANPEVMDNFDFDEIARDTHRMLGAPEKWLRSSDKRTEMRKARSARQQEAENLQKASIQAKALKDIASSPVSPATLGGKIAASGAEGGGVM